MNWGYVAIKLDPKKAYDKLDWLVIKKCFLELVSSDKRTS